MNLPSFLWLWKIAAWSMGFTILGYLILLLSGGTIMYTRKNSLNRPSWLRTFHYITGFITIILIFILLLIGLVGTIGYYGSLGHSIHLVAGILTVFLILLSAWSATQISTQNSWARSLHVGINVLLLGGLIFVSITGWEVVQKYL